MEGAPSPAEDLELSVLEEQPDEQAPLNGVQVQPCSEEDPSPAQVDKKSPWSACTKNVVGKCKLWMVVTSVFLGLVVVIIIGLCVLGATYIDEDENAVVELTSNKTFFIMFKIPAECVTEEELPHQLTQRRKMVANVFSVVQSQQVVRGLASNYKHPEKSVVVLCLTQPKDVLTDVYSTSVSLSRYFTSVEIVDFSGENATVTYQLQFGVPSEDDDFMEYVMSEELVLGILLQNIHDQNIPSCEILGLDPESLSFYE